MRVIDFHTHVYPNKIAEKATTALWDPQGEVKSFLRLGLSESDQEKIAFRNALKILNVNP